MTDEETKDDRALFPAAAAFNSATQLFMEQLQQVSDLTRSAGTATWTDPTGRSGTQLAGELFDRLRSMAAQVPAPTAHLDTFLQELRAKRALIGALQMQLNAFEREMELLEQALQPLQEWGHQWSGMQRLMTDPPWTPGSRRADAGAQADVAGPAGPGDRSETAAGDT